MPERFADKRARAGRIVRALKQAYPDARCALHHSSPLELLVATILSAQCTDERVNQVTRGLFAKYRSACDFVSADPHQLENEIRSTGFYRNKTKHIQAASAALVERHHGEVPNTMEALVELPGVARKTANVVLGTAFGKTAGIVVDTHVHRLAKRLDLSREKDPEKVEQNLMSLVPEEDWIQFSYMLIEHGRTVCKARTPQCGICVLSSNCPSASLEA
ncbi:endonuclease III [candidate division TA06 bacterium SM1_40]|uniref:Endonuclease III n=2 Tax=Bacteria division TA06 TaxID=1156500 RepID=A0A0S8JFQ3_UNCT6|nr:MAG: endonuclease III [candidate division TA06 bacterium SM23_40]KPL08561.1 MAG: endonuclease III [candidate division TA06 bacterium SM1_40]